MATFNIDASALLDDLSASLVGALKENVILRHQLKDAEKQIDALTAQIPKDNDAGPQEGTVRDIKKR